MGGGAGSAAELERGRAAAGDGAVVGVVIAVMLTGEKTVGELAGKAWVSDCGDDGVEIAICIAGPPKECAGVRTYGGSVNVNANSSRDVSTNAVTKDIIGNYPISATQVLRTVLPIWSCLE